MENQAAVARVIHAAMLVAVVASAAILKSVADGDPAFSDRASLLLRFVGLMALVLAGLVIRLLRGRLPLLVSETDATTWWSAHFSTLVTLWAIAEGVGILGSVLWFLTGDTVVLVVLTGASIALLLRLGPTRWVAEPDSVQRG